MRAVAKLVLTLAVVAPLSACSVDAEQEKAIGLDAATQVVPVADRVHGFVADDLLQHDRRRRPVDPPQHQEAAIEPGREQVREVGVDRRQVVTAIERIQQLLAHPHERGGAVRLRHAA